MKPKKPQKAKFQKAHVIAPRLRMICNGDERVNAIRAELSASVVSDTRSNEKYGLKATLHREAGKAGEPPRREAFSSEFRVSCFVHYESPEHATIEGGKSLAFRT